MIRDIHNHGQGKIVARGDADVDATSIDRCPVYTWVVSDPAELLFATDADVYHLLSTILTHWN
jgi:hypothetical protein